MMFGSILLVPVVLMMAYQVVLLTVPVIMMGVAFSLIPAGMAWRPSRHEQLRGTGNENE